jgi:hypothetical protein
VFSVAGSNKFFVQIVANKYNPANYWCVTTYLEFHYCSAYFCFLRSGRWRSEYVVDLNEYKVDGKILANVHYYEQGNVCHIVRLDLLPNTDCPKGPTGNGSHTLNIATICSCEIFSCIICIKDSCSRRRRRRQISDLFKRDIPRDGGENFQRFETCPAYDKTEIRLGQGNRVLATIQSFTERDKLLIRSLGTN